MSSECRARPVPSRVTSGPSCVFFTWLSETFSFPKSSALVLVVEACPLTSSCSLHSCTRKTSSSVFRGNWTQFFCQCSRVRGTGFCKTLVTFSAFEHTLNTYMLVYSNFTRSHGLICLYIRPHQVSLTLMLMYTCITHSNSLCMLQNHQNPYREELVSNKCSNKFPLFDGFKHTTPQIFQVWRSTQNSDDRGFLGSDKGQINL